MTSQDSSHRPSGPSPASGSQSQRPATNPPIKRWVIWDASNKDWDVSDSPSPNGHKKPIVLGDGSGGHEIQFHLKVGGLSWQFDCNDPIWTADNVKCGTLSHLASDQLKVTSCTPHLLTVWDENEGDARLVRYQLNFSDSGGGQAPPACDPAILNGGGGRI